MVSLEWIGYNEEEPKLKLKENIRISKARQECRCAWCRAFISKGMYHYSINNTTSFKASFISDVGQPIHIHLECVMPMAERMEKHKLLNSKRMVINKLKGEE